MMDYLDKSSYVDTLKISADAVVAKEKLKNKKVLITGASGLIGSAIADLIRYFNRECHYNIKLFVAGRRIDRLKERFRKDECIQYLLYDAEKEFRCSEMFDAIIHCASNAHPAAYVTQPVETLIANVFGTQQLLEYLKTQNSGRLLLVSSSEVYGNHVNNGLYREQEYYGIDILNPRACYPSGKRTAETLCSCYLGEYGVDSVIVRPGHIYGPTMTSEDSRAYAQFVRDVLKGRNIVMKSEGNQLRSYCYVMDCASAILSVLTKGKSGEAYNISNRNSIVTIRQLAETIATAAGKKVCMELPSDVERKGYNLMTCSALNSEKLESLGWFGRFDLKTGVDYMLKIMNE